MAIRFYMNGTEGATDGTEISNGDLTNPLVVDGFYPAAGVTVEKKVRLMIRADSGETYKGVTVALISTTTNEKSKFSINANHNMGCTNRNGYDVAIGAFYPELKDINQYLDLTVAASGDETNSPDTTQKLMVIGGVQV